MNASTPTQPPTSANNTINAKGNLPSDAMNVSTPAQPPTTANNQHHQCRRRFTFWRSDSCVTFFAARAVEAEDNLPAGSKDIIVGGYHIDGVANIVSEESSRHVVVFYEAAIPYLKKSQNKPADE